VLRQNGAIPARSCALPPSGGAPPGYSMPQKCHVDMASRAWRAELDVSGAAARGCGLWRCSVAGRPGWVSEAATPTGIQPAVVILALSVYSSCSGDPAGHLASVIRVCCCASGVLLSCLRGCNGRLLRVFV